MNISVLITYYRGSKYIENTFFSILKALSLIKGKHEILIVNDSNDEEEKNFLIELLEKNSSFYHNIKIEVINNIKNFGVTESRRIGISKLNGDAIHIIDQDDLIDEKFYYEAIKSLNKGEKAIVFNGFKIDKSGKIIKKNLFKHKNLSTLDKKINNVYTYFTGGCHIITPGMIIFSRYIKNVIYDIYELMSLNNREGIFDAIDDYYLYIFLLKRNIKFKYINQYLFFYRCHNDSQRDRKKSQIKLIQTSNLLYSEGIFKGKNYINKKAKFILDIENRKYYVLPKHIFTILRYIKSVYY